MTISMHPPNNLQPKESAIRIPDRPMFIPKTALDGDGSEASALLMVDSGNRRVIGGDLERSLL